MRETMLRKVFITVLLALAPLTLFSARFPSKAPPTDIRVIPVKPTPEPETVSLRFLFPKAGEIESGGRVNVQLKIQGFPLRVNSSFARDKEVWNDPNGQHIHVVVDKHSYFPVKWDTIKSVDPRENYYTQIAEFEIPYSLEPGEHIIRAYPVRSFHESLKGPGNFAEQVFYYQSESPYLDQNIKGPYITYNVPRPDRVYSSAQPLLLDFYISNVALSRDGYKVEFILDETHKRYLTMWTPYYIYGIQPGTHTIRLRLLDPQNKLVPGEFNDITKTIKVQ